MDIVSINNKEYLFVKLTKPSDNLMLLKVVNLSTKRFTTFKIKKDTMVSSFSVRKPVNQYEEIAMTNILNKATEEERINNNVNSMLKNTLNEICDLIGISVEDRKKHPLIKNYIK